MHVDKANNTKVKSVRGKTDDNSQMSKYTSENLPFFADRRKDIETYQESANENNAMTYCPRFEKCSAPKCPFDTLIETRYEDPEDPQCSLGKEVRHKIWKKLPSQLRGPLKFEGYFEAERNKMAAAKRRWDLMSTEQKSKMMRGLKK